MRFAMQTVKSVTCLDDGRIFAEDWPEERFPVPRQKQTHGFLNRDLPKGFGTRARLPIHCQECAIRSF